MGNIIRARLSHLDEIAPLFDAYRQFYEQKADPIAVRTYVEQRLANDEAVVFLAMDKNNHGIGFTLLYPTFCSVELRHVFVLYDLFVAPSARRSGIGEALLKTAQDHAQSAGAAWLKLETAHTNRPAQSLYEKLGWERDNEFHTYFLSLHG
ncbi:MAG: GNAT family N-acetyltransferase [Pseudomonadota bacterium]